MDAQLRIVLSRADEGGGFVVLHTYYCFEAPVVDDWIELGPEQFRVVKRFWQPLQVSTTVTVLVEPV